jgi:hypothetical protein
MTYEPNFLNLAHFRLTSRTKVLTGITAPVLVFTKLYSRISACFKQLISGHAEDPSVCNVFWNSSQPMLLYL